MGLLWRLDLPNDMNDTCPEHYSLKAVLTVSLTPKKPICLANRIENTSD